MKPVIRNIIVISIGIVFSIPSFVSAELLPIDPNNTYQNPPTNLSVPFTMQAPYSQWGIQPWEDACEETVTQMVAEFYRGNTSTNLDKKHASDLIQHVVNLENMYLGFNKDTNADQITYIINNFFPFEAHIKENPTFTTIKSEIRAKRPVIALFHGQSVNNPYFRRNGPEYHTAVITGFDDAKQDFITNEPGVGVGRGYRYDYNIFLNSFRDFLPNGKTHLGRRVSVFTRPNLTDLSRHKDADQDGLGKELEFEYGTKPWLYDTDQDGFSDGEEVQKGYSPTTDETKLTSGALVRLLNDSKIYILDGTFKRHITNENAFVRNGYNWTNIVVVGPTFLATFENGLDIH